MDPAAGVKVGEGMDLRSPSHPMQLPYHIKSPPNQQNQVSSPKLPQFWKSLRVQDLSVRQGLDRVMRLQSSNLVEGTRKSSNQRFQSSSL